MRQHRLFLSILCIGMVIGLVNSVSAQISAGHMTIKASKHGALSVRTSLEASFLRSAKLRVYDGKQKKQVNLRPVKAVEQGESIDVFYKTEHPLDLQLNLKPVGRCIVWQMTCRNTGADQLWLELGPELRVESSEVLTVFTGWDDVVNPKKLLSPEEQKYPHWSMRFPVTAVWNKRATLGVGLEPGELVSYYTHSYQPLNLHSGLLVCTSRIVVDAGKEEAVRFVTCAAPGEWGKYEMMEAYYESFPSYFVPYPGVDPRINLGDSMQNAWPGSEWRQESCRRTYCGWAWCYAPFRRTGDILCRPELWEYNFYRKPERHYALSRDKFLDWRREAFANCKKDGVADLFYVDVVWCEDALARERYPDALITGPDAGILKGATSGCDLERNVFPLNTTFGKQYEEDTRAIVEEFDPVGFALDCAGNAWRYTGPALATLPGRAWDDKVGVYCSSYIGVAKYMDFVHTLKRKDGSLTAIVPNPETGGPFAVYFRGDAAMLEGTPWSVERTHADRIRWKLGQKPLVWHCTYRLDELFDESTLTAEQLKLIYRGLADFTLLQSLRLGGIPNPWMAGGNKKLMTWLPAIVECVKTGWQPVPAARVPEPMWSSRYGRGLKTLIAVAHETASPVQGTVTVQNARISDGIVLFSHYDGKALTNTIADSQTLVSLEIPVRTPILLRAQMEILSPDVIVKAEVSEDMGIAGGKLTALIEGNGSTKVRIRIPEDMRIDAVIWNGKKIDPVDGSDSSEFLLTNNRQGELEVQYRSQLFALDDQDLLEYPFVVDGKPNCTLVVGSGATEMEHLMAYRLQEYFRYWYGVEVEPTTKVVLPIVETDRPVDGATVNFRIDPELSSATISWQGDILTIAAPDEKQLEYATLATLRALDRKYWTLGRLAGFPIIKKLGLEKTVLE